jgi:prepilin-type N-terminal cleavage/methylation domain-containing protein
MLQRGGFTLLEVLLVMAIMAMIAVFSVSSYRNYSKSIELDSISKNIVYDLRQMQVRAASGENRLNFGAHLVNGTTDYYELFSSPTNYIDVSKTIISTINLPITVYFTVPAEGVNKDIIFSSISGGASADFLTISSEGNSQTVNVTASGAVY